MGRSKTVPIKTRNIPLFGSKKEKELFPLNSTLQSLKEHIIDSLPAAHSLTGCDTVTKVGTKASMFKILESNEVMLKIFLMKKS